MNLLTAIRNYIGRDGLVHRQTRDSVGVVSENGALFSVEYIVSLMKQTDISDGDKRIELQRIKIELERLEVYPGITVRSRVWNPRYDSMDNMGALLVFSSMFGSSEFAKRMRDAGENVACTGVDLTPKLSKFHLYHIEENKKYYFLARLVSTIQGMGFFKAKYYWNNRTPTLFCFFSWFGRSPGFLGLLDIAATGRTTRFRELALFIGQMIVFFESKDKLASRTLGYLNWQLLKNRGPFWKFAYEVWYKKLRADYPGGMKEVYSLSRGKTHPLTIYSVE